jgi:hypothetical protein
MAKFELKLPKMGRKCRRNNYYKLVEVGEQN